VDLVRFLLLEDCSSVENKISPIFISKFGFGKISECANPRRNVEIFLAKAQALVQ
jgi:hypothetical protein